MSTRPWMLAFGSALLISVGAAGLRGARADAPARLPPCAAVGRTHLHAHNDYGHARPLFDALEHGAASVEADVWLVDGELRVAHDRDQTTPARTLEALYLRPLRELLEQHRIGPETCRSGLQLLIDIKSEAEPSLRALERLLDRYRDMLTHVANARLRRSAITVVISGERAPDLLDRKREHWAGYDGRIADLDSSVPAALMPLVSNAWSELFAWDGSGPMPSDEREKLRGFVSRGHAAGRRVRFWATPEAPDKREAVWAELIAAGVDYINSDQLEAAEQFLARRAAKSRR